jgi:3-methylfumaryl-CoA hydratase
MSQAAHELITRFEACDLANVRRVAAMLDLDPDGVKEGDPLPRGWHFVLMGADTRRSELRADGYPGLGVPMPDLGLPRLMIGGRSVEYLGDIPIGASVRRVSGVESLTNKTTAGGPMALATIAHQLFVGAAQEPALVERQTFVLLSAGKAAAPAEDAVQQVEGAKLNTVVPDQTLLFQYSALGFNSHKIHIDREYARDVEGFPDLVVNGGLTTLMLTEFARTAFDLSPSKVKVKFVAPLFCGRPMTLTGDPGPGGWRFGAYNDRGKLAAEMELSVA